MSNGESEKKETSGQQGALEYCSYCEKEFAVTRYGWRIPCPHCHKLLDILPDPKIFLYIDGKPIGIAIVEGGEEAFSAVLSKFFTKILTLAKFL